TICPQGMSIWHRQFCGFLESNRRKKWTAEVCPKQWLVSIRWLLEEKRKRKRSKPKKSSQQEPGDSRFKFHALVQQSISMTATAVFLRTPARKSDSHQNLRDLASQSCFARSVGLLRSVRFAARSGCIGSHSSRSPGRACLSSIRSARPYVRQSLRHLMVPIHVRFVTSSAKEKIRRRNRICGRQHRRST